MSRLVQYELPDNRAFNIELAPVPLSMNVFQIMVVPIVNALEGWKNEWLSVGYTPERKDGISAIQVYKDVEAYVVELVVYPKNSTEFSIFSFQTTDMDLVLDLFKYVCVYFSCPIEIGWKTVDGRKVQTVDAIVFKDRIIWKDVTSVVNYLN